MNALGNAAKLAGASLFAYAALSDGSRGDGRESARIAEASRASELLDANAVQSGRRLKPTYLESSDGARQFTGWRDTSRNLDCSFAVASDGAWRCLPAGAAAGWYFGDAACTQPLASVPKGCEEPSYAVFNDRSTCASAPLKHVFAAGPRFTGPIAYWMTGGACVAVSSADLVLIDLYAMGDELPAASFIQATASTAP